ncbi:MAG: hypothetical protein IJH78_03105 [Clostridia bacterium]|nr:hypothetical protein [Clostridia bacterium]
MIPFGGEKATLYRRTREADGTGRSREVFRRVLLAGCSWKRAREHAAAGTALLPAGRIRCRIPADQARPEPGDLLVRGVCGPESLAPAEAAALAASGAYEAARVLSVRDGAAPGAPLPHCTAEGESL